MKKHTYNIIVLAMFVIFMTSCGIYSFTGTSIQPDVKTVNIEYFEYKALKVNPTLANDLTEAMKDKFRKLTKLEQVDGDADLTIAGEITGYDVKATSVSANEQAAMNRLTVNVKIYFTNKKYPEDEDLLEDVIVENKQAIEMANIYSGILTGMTDSFASIISNNLNVVMKTLAIITIVLSIPTMIYSAYGMNVHLGGMPFADSPWGFLIIVAFSIVLSVLVTILFIKMKMFK